MKVDGDVRTSGNKPDLPERILKFGQQEQVEVEPVSSDVFPSTAICADEPGVSSDIVDDGEAMNVD